MRGKHDYPEMLRRRTAEAAAARAEAAPISLTAYKAQRDIERWRERYAAHIAGMMSLAGSPSRQLPAIPTEGGSADTSGGPLDAA